jgi:hypothetical protein
MAISPELRAQIERDLDAVYGPRKPKLAAKAPLIAEVRVSRADPNWPASREGLVRVERGEGLVTINWPAYERQREEEARDRARARALDPYRLGHWGPVGGDGEGA